MVNNYKLHFSYALFREQENTFGERPFRAKGFCGMSDPRLAPGVIHITLLRSGLVRMYPNPMALHETPSELFGEHISESEGVTRNSFGVIW